MEDSIYFVSYVRTDSELALRLASELRAAGVGLWMDQLDLQIGERWDRSVEAALKRCQGMLALLSPESLASDNVMDEISFALESGKRVLPIILRPCEIPFRLRRVQYVDLVANYEEGMHRLLRAVGSAKQEEVAVQSKGSERNLAPDGGQEGPASTNPRSAADWSAGGWKAASSEFKRLAGRSPRLAGMLAGILVGAVWGLIWGVLFEVGVSLTSGFDLTGLSTVVGAVFMSSVAGAMAGAIGRLRRRETYFVLAGAIAGFVLWWLLYLSWGVGPGLKSLAKMAILGSGPGAVVGAVLGAFSRRFYGPR